MWGLERRAGGKAMQASWPLEERRNFSRFGRDEDTDFAALRLPSGEETIAMVFDESLGGISLVVDDARRLFIGAEVRIAYAGCSVRAQVKHMRPFKGGAKSIVGFATERLG
jgi:hypothetical protein